MTLGLCLHFLSDYIFILLMYNFISILSYPHYTYSDVYLHHFILPSILITILLTIQSADHAYQGQSAIYEAAHQKLKI